MLNSLQVRTIDGTSEYLNIHIIYDIKTRNFELSAYRNEELIVVFNPDFFVALNQLLVKIEI